MINFCIHGHFYQPPRENPWTGEIEKQDSAEPFHNWNERIYQECYKPNAVAEVITDDSTKVKVNNYEYMNFNFGPTLFSWIVQKHPFLLKKLLDADRKSSETRNGHGNAIAQVYNHVIMPLACKNDKITQVRWGMSYFEHYFKRRSEGIWLSETACDLATIEVLISENIKYIILDNNQANTVRKIGTKEWTDVSNNSINPFMPYRHFSENEPDKYVDIFFYDGPLSKSMAFEDILVHSEFLSKRVEHIASYAPGGNFIISAATDGETFGHHKKDAARTLAYFFIKHAPLSNIKMVNYGEFLEANPPTWEVKLKSGEGTSWSCIHGVSRWKDDCGCGGGEWRQQWRKPLRESLDWLRECIDEIYVKYGSDMLKNIWDVRNDYINILLCDTPDEKAQFIKRHKKRELSIEEQENVFRLMELQKFGMLMYTSCAWFFAEISGLETVKILEYSYRCIQLAEEITGDSLLEEFSEKLSEAQSNIPEFKNGKYIFEKFVVEPNIRYLEGD